MSNNNKDFTEKRNSSEEEIFLYQRKPMHLNVESADDKFDVIVPKKRRIILFAIFAVLFFIQFFYFTGFYMLVFYPEYYDLETYPIFPYYFIPLIFLVITIVPILAWGQIGSRIASNSIVKYLKKTVEKTRPKFTEIFLGYPMRTKDIYYLEAYPVDLDLGSDFVHLKVFIKRVMEVLFISIGMSVIIAQITAPFLWSIIYDPYITQYGWYWNIEELMIDITIYMGPFTLLILTFVMPVFWIAEDTQAYRVNEYQDSVRLGYYLRTGPISKILGFFGIVLAFNLAQELATALLTGGEQMSYGELMSRPELAIQLYTTILIWFVMIIAMCAAAPFLVTLVYLSYYHERWVNNVRIRASEFMQLGTLEIRKPKMINLKYMNRPEMIDETGGFFQTKKGKLILFLLIIIAAFICLYFAYVLGFEEALFA
ncbi:MAG: hypothetical protein ACFFDK_02470 [Promethearchaeota archaeon]